MPRWPPLSGVIRVCRAPAALGAGGPATLGRDPGLPSAGGAGHPGPAGDDVWAASAGPDLPSNHAAQIDQLVDDLLAGHRHDTTLASTRLTMEFVTALYAS